MIIKVQAAVCYADPKQAYEYLLAQENYEMQAREQAVVDINSASEGELVTLDGIGSSKAQAIILYREMFGPFTSVDELEKVKGIGAKTIANNRARMRVQH
uniref:ComEA family DNA-binding protein n=1 Tax=uncultured Psychrobacter sp. TaxID=259303 RepID=UPI00261E74B4|nr:ComEA family DNA-binding protein [uncultured Psychrobacter sp.]